MAHISNHIKTVLLSLLVVTLMAFICDRTYADQAGPVGTVVAVRGNVQAINKAGESRKLKAKGPLYLEDTIKTGPRGRLQIMFTDKTIVSLGGKSEMKIAEYAWDKEKKDGKITTKVKEGAFRVMGGLISKAAPKKFKTETPAATIGIRGSMYAGKVTGEQLSVVFEGGKGITLQNATGMEVITIPGYGSHMRSWNAPISKPAKFTTQDIMNLNKEFMSSRERKSIKDAQKQNVATQRPVTFSSQDITNLRENTLKDIAPEAATDRRQEVAGEQELLATKLTEAARENPAAASAILREAVMSNKMNTREALNAVLLGMRNPDKNTFDSLINAAIELGLTAEGAKEVADVLKARGGCR